MVKFVHCIRLVLYNNVFNQCLFCSTWWSLKLQCMLVVYHYLVHLLCAAITARNISYIIIQVYMAKHFEENENMDNNNDRPNDRAGNTKWKFGISVFGTCSGTFLVPIPNFRYFPMPIPKIEIPNIFSVVFKFPRRVIFFLNLHRHFCNSIYFYQ